MLINDASITGSLTVNASASFQHIIVSGNIIPDTNSTRNLGSTDKYFKEIYVSTSSINFVDNGSVVATLNAGTINAIQTNTSSANSRLDAIESFTSSLNNTYTTDAELNASSSTLTSNINTKLNSSSFNSFTASVAATNTFTSSATLRLNAIETTTASVNTTLAGINIKTGSYATTGSNSFIGNQTITGSLIVSCVATISSSYVGNNSSMTLNSGSNFYIQNNGAAEITGSLRVSGSLSLIGNTNLATTGSNTFYGTQIISGTTWIAGDFIVQGSSSIQNITGSSINIGTNIINVNTANPAVRYAGLSVQDSGSANGVTGSLLWDSSCNRWIYSNPSTIGYSGGMLLSGPRASTLGTETTLTCNYIAKSGGGDHLYDSCIVDDGTTVCVNTTLKASGQVCGVMGNFSCIGVGTTTPGYKIQIVNSADTYQFGINGGAAGTSYYAVYTGDGGQSLGSRSNHSLALFTNDTDRFKIANNGIACFSCQICTPKISINGSDDGVGSLWVNAGSTTMNAGRFRGCSSNYSVLDVCNNYAGGIGVYAEAGRHYFGGCVGIGCNTPGALLHVAGTASQSTPNLRLTDSSVSGNGGNVYISADKQGVGYNSLTTIAYTHTFKGGGSASNYLTIDLNGISTFTCQLCALQYRGYNYGVAPQGVFRGGLYVCNAVSGTGTDCSLTLFSEGGAGGGNFYIATGGSADVKFAMDANGIACFRCLTCVKSLTTFGGGIQQNFNGSGEGHVTTYFAAKYINENTTQAFFRITTSGASSTQVHLAASNSGVGWYSGQMYIAANSAYWGGWIGSGTNVSLVGQSAGYISGVYSDGAGGQNYCVTVANNGTGTSSLVWAYITTITYAGYSTSFTQL